MTAPHAQDAGDSAALRAEHDALARRLEIRASIDELRKGLLRLFVGLISTGVALRLAFDRWGPSKPGLVRELRGPPVFLWIASAVALALLVLAVRALVRSRRLARDEDRLFARFREVRAGLGLER
jgi:hypothetical protein